MTKSEYEEFKAQLRSLIIEYKPTTPELLRAVSSLDKLMSGLQAQPSKVEAPPREGQKI